MTSRIATYLLLLFVGIAAPAAAQTTVKGEQSVARMIVDRPSVAAKETLWVGLDIRMTPNWHSYWRTPGDSGLPTSIRWKLPEGFTAGEIQWPPPERVPTGDLMNFGYDEHVTLLVPMEITAQPGEVTLEADATWLVCADVCIPEDGHFSFPVNVVAQAGSPPGPDAQLIEAARASIPKKAAFPVQAKIDGANLVVTVPSGLPAGIKNAVLFPDGDGVISNAAPQEVKLNGDSLTLSIPLGATPPTKLAGVLVADGADGRVGYEIASDVGGAAGGSSVAAVDMTVWLALLFAVLGGLVLNVMPCVLPVLVMKALSVVSRGQDPAAMRRDAIIYTAGVMSAFTALVVVLLALRAAGDSIGWGFQLQNPIVVTVLANVMLVMGLSMSGVFNFGTSIAGVGQGLTQTSGGWGSYFTGVLAVVVAAPCTAPFMGPAIGYALTQSPIASIAVFEGLAIGLALPYLAIAFVPAFARALPRPGMWMERVKQILAFGLYGAAAWMVWVVSQQVAADGLALVFASLVVVAFAGWAYGVAPTAKHTPRWMVTAAIALLLAVGTIAGIEANAPSAARAESGAHIEPYSPERLAALRASGKPVLVNFTAAWCITCLVNERVALSKPEVQEAFRTSGVTFLKGDWTNRDASITAALRDLGRDGVPVYALYPANSGPQLLPQILTPGLVIEALKGVQVSAGATEPRS